MSSSRASWRGLRGLQRYTRRIAPSAWYPCPLRARGYACSARRPTRGVEHGGSQYRPLDPLGLQDPLGLLSSLDPLGLQDPLVDRQRHLARPRRARREQRARAPRRPSGGRTRAAGSRDAPRGVRGPHAPSRRRLRRPRCTRRRRARAGTSLHACLEGGRFFFAPFTARLWGFSRLTPSFFLF